MKDIDFNSVVLSTRVRLARNFEKYPFVPKLSEKDAENIIEKVKDSVIFSNKKAKDTFQFYDAKELKKQGGVLLEKHLISPNIIESKVPSALILNNENNISIMINEEDHLRIQVINPGYALEDSYSLANSVDDLIEENNEYAFSEKYGFLTSCPTNIGTGMRASLMLHIPAICLSGRLNDMIQTVNRLGIAVRGIYGEGTQASGNLFQFSNQVTLGLSEADTLDKLKNIIKQIVEQELNLRNKLKNDLLLDKIYRSYGILKSCYLISYNEFMDLWSNTLLGIDMGIINNIERTDFINLTHICGPYSIIHENKENVDHDSRDKKRAEILRKILTFEYC